MRELSVFGLSLLLVACSSDGRGSSTPTSGPSGIDNPGPGHESSTGTNTAGSATADVAGKLCVNLDDIEVEPVDLDALVDEAPQSKIPDAVASLLDAAHAHGPVVASGQAAAGSTPQEFLVPLARCQGQACSALVVTVDDRGKELRAAVLPGAGLFGPSTTLRLQAARADVDSDGRPELWVGYQVGDGEAEPGIDHMAVFAFPGLEPLWHAAISQTSPDPSARGCDGVLYPVDVDCDGDGDLVLARRCGEPGCLDDDSEDCGTIEESIAIHRWDSDARVYRESPSQP